MTTKKFWGVQIAGLGDPSLDTSGIKTVFSWRAYINPAALPDSYYFESLAKFASLGGRELEPLEGLVSQSTTALTFNQLDRDEDFSSLVLGKSILSYFWVPSGVRPGAVIDIGFSATFGSFTILTKTGFGPPAVDSIVYLGREAMVIEIVTPLGGNRYKINPYSRGALGTKAQAHDLRDPDVFYGIAANPLRRDREVTLYELEIDDSQFPSVVTETIRFRGVVEVPRINKNLSYLTLSCRDLFGRLTMLRFGADAWSGEIRMRRGTLDATHVRYPYIVGANVPGSPVPYQPLYADNPGTVGGRSDKAITLAIDGHAILAWAKFSQIGRVPGEPWAFYHGVQAMGRIQELDGNFLDIGDDIKTYTAHEILIIDADNPVCTCRDDIGKPSDHPSDIMRNLLTSTGTASWPDGGPHVVGDNGAHDWLEKPWGAALEASILDGPAFDKLIEQAPTGSDDASQRLRARSTYLGGESDVPALETLFSFAQAMNSYIYQTPDGLLSIRHFSDPGVGNVDHTITTDQVRALDSDEGLGSDVELEDRESVYRIKFELAQRGPGGEPGFYLHAQDFGERRLQRYAYLCTEDVVSSTRIYGDPVTHTVPQRLIDQLTEVFAFRWEYLQFRLPQYVIELTNNTPRVTAGQWISLTHPALFDNDYSRGITSHRCLVMRDQLNLSTFRQKIHVIDFAPLDLSTTLIAPSWTIETVTSDTLFLVEADRHSDDDRAFLRADPDAPYDLWSPQLTLRSTDGPVDATGVGGGNVTLSGAWTSGAVPVTPNVGDIVRLASYDNRKDWDGLLGFSNTWIADANGLLGAANDPGFFWSV
jgi:hypothetical protein